MTLSHHELCFGCGRTNLFGLLLEVQQTGPNAVSGRGFIKQDHQGADRASAHEGVLMAALGDAMALACGPGTRATNLELRISGKAQIGSFLDVTASAETTEARVLKARASASSEGRPVASATGTYVLS